MSTRARRILGVDPGLNTTGYGVIEVVASDPQSRSASTGVLSAGGQGIRLIEAGVVRSRPRADLETRLAEIHQGVREVIEQHEPELLALEQLYSHYERPTTAILMGHARGVICLAAAGAGIAVAHFEPTRVKKVMTGNGRAPKHQIQLAVKVQLGLPDVPDPPDIADALAIALCGHHLGQNDLIEKLTRST